MTEVLQANVFFFITALAVIVFVAMLCVALFHIITVLKLIRRIVARIDEGTATLSEDMRTIRTHMAGGGVVRKLLHFLFGVLHSDTEKKGDTENETAMTKKSETRKEVLKVKQ